MILFTAPFCILHKSSKFRNMEIITPFFLSFKTGQTQIIQMLITFSALLSYIDSFKFWWEFMHFWIPKIFSWLPENTYILTEEKVEMTQKNPHLYFGAPQKMSQLGDIGSSTLTDFSAFWGPSWDPLKEQICSVNNHVMIVVAGTARAWDATCLHTPTAFREQSGAVWRWSRWSPCRSEPGKAVTPHSEVFRPAGLWGCQDNMSPQASYLWSTDCSVWRTIPSPCLVNHLDFL